MVILNQFTEHINIWCFAKQTTARKPIARKTTTARKTLANKNARSRLPNNNCHKTAVQKTTARTQLAKNKWNIVFSSFFQGIWVEYTIATWRDQISYISSCVNYIMLIDCAFINKNNWVVIHLYYQILIFLFANNLSKGIKLLHRL